MKKILIILFGIFAFWGCEKEPKACDLENYGIYTIYNRSSYSIRIFADGNQLGIVSSDHSEEFNVPAGASVEFYGLSTNGSIHWDWSDKVSPCGNYRKTLTY
jgi:hypothetical protein